MLIIRLLRRDWLILTIMEARLMPTAEAIVVIKKSLFSDHSVFMVKYLGYNK